MHERLVRFAVDTLNSDGGWLYLYDDNGVDLGCEASFQNNQAFSGDIQGLSEQIAKQVLQMREQVLCDEQLPQDFHDAKCNQLETVSFIGVPVILQTGTLGSLVLSRVGVDGHFTPTDIEQALLCSEQIAMAYENKLLRDRLDQRDTQLVSLNELSQALVDAEDIQTLTDSLADHLNTMIHSKGCYILLKEQYEPAISAVLLSPMEDVPSIDESHPGHLRLANKILKAGKSFQMQDCLESPYFEPEIAQQLSIKSALAIPMIVGGREMGAALIFFSESHSFDEEELAICDQAMSNYILAVDKIRVFGVEHRRRSVLEAIRQASIRLTSSLELEPVLDAILDQALTLVKADDAHIFLYEDDRLSFAAARWADGRPSEPYALPRQEGITYSVARGGRRMVSSDVNDHPLFQDWKWGGAIASHPLQIEDQVVGVMNVAFERPHRFQEEELRVLELLAAQAAIALRNARLFSHTNTDRNRTQLLLEVTNALVTELDEDSILQRAIDLIVNSLDASLGEAFLLEQNIGRLHLRALAGKSSLSRDELDEVLDLHLGKGLEGWVVEWKEPLAIPEVERDKRWLRIDGVNDNIRSSFSVPVISEGVVFGVLTVLFEEEADVGQLDLLIAVGRQVGLALSNAYKYRQINRRVAELAALQEVGRVINSRMQMSPLLEEIVHQVSQVLGYEIVAVYLVEGENLELRAAIGAEEHRMKTISMTEGIIGRVARTTEPAYVPDVSKDPDYLSSIPMSRAEIAVPLIRGDIVVGVLNVESPLRGGLNENDFRLLLLLSDQISVAIESASLYEHLSEQAEKLEDLVEERTAELADALEHARVAERLKTQFVADVSHELRTPLANIRLYIELLSFGNPDRFEEYLGTLARETDRLVNLIEELLAISRLDSGASIPNPQPIDPNYLVKNLVEDRQRLLNERSLQVNLELDNHLPLVSADEQMISQTIANLLTNAMHFTKPGGKITIKTFVDQEEDKEWAKLSILDTGVGIPPEEQERIFERFFRGAASRLLSVPGTGLGLAISKELIDLHNGKITMMSKLNEGSQFTIWLPIPSKMDRN